jgi:hypothetical protein
LTKGHAAHWLVREGGVVSLKARLRAIFLCLVLECGAITGVPMTPEKIRAVLESMHQPKLAQVLPTEDDEGGEPPEALVVAVQQKMGTWQVNRKWGQAPFRRMRPVGRK